MPSWRARLEAQVEGESADIALVRVADPLALGVWPMELETIGRGACDTDARIREGAWQILADARWAKLATVEQAYRWRLLNADADALHRLSVPLPGLNPGLTRPNAPRAYARCWDPAGAPRPAAGVAGQFRQRTRNSGPPCNIVTSNR